MTCRTVLISRIRPSGRFQRLATTTVAQVGVRRSADPRREDGGSGPPVPLTFPSHAAAVMPLKPARPRWFDGVALVAGSTAPAVRDGVIGVGRRGDPPPVGRPRPRSTAGHHGGIRRPGPPHGGRRPLVGRPAHGVVAGRTGRVDLRRSTSAATACCTAGPARRPWSRAGRCSGGRPVRHRGRRATALDGLLPSGDIPIVLATPLLAAAEAALTVGAAAVRLATRRRSPGPAGVPRPEAPPQPRPRSV